MEYAQSIGQITAAFAEVPPPADGTIVCHDYHECRALRDDVRGHTPDELSDEWIEKSLDQLPLLSD